MTESVVESSEYDLEQMWKCARCGKKRQWGYGPSAEPRYRAFLYCSCMKSHVRHEYIGLNPIRSNV